jgi:APA family basic amino acid/polyamine antiporter
VSNDHAATADALGTEVAAPGYLRRLGIWDTAMIVVGGVIGSGIFLTPATVAERTQTSSGVMIAWAFGALFGITGALCYAELGARRPQAGGTYVYLREAFGPMTAFLFGWIMLLINYPGCIAMGAVTFAKYAAQAMGYGEELVRPLSIGAIGVLAVINFTGVRSGATLQNVLTTLKFVAIIAVIVAGLIVAAPALPAPAAAARAVAEGGFLRYGSIIMPVLFAYGGWAYANNVAGEIRNPQRNIPRALVTGMCLVAACYLLVNLAYLTVLGHDGLAASPAPASAVMKAAFGETGARLIAIGIAISTLGFCNISMLGGARVFQVMGADGLFFKATGHMNPRFHTPDVALFAIAAWAIVLAQSGTFGQLLNYSNFADWLGYAGAVATLFYYRKLRDQAAVFSVPGFPLLPGLFVVVTLLVLTCVVIDSPGDAGVALLITLAGVPAYWFWTRGSRNLRG